MATGGSDLSTRMSTENTSICDIALRLFKTHKVEISVAINTKFPFLGYLCDHGFITYEIYKSYMKRSGVQEVIYDVLNKLEKTFDLSLVEALFSKFIMNQYPGLNNIYEIFKAEIPELLPEYEREQRPDVQLSHEQGTAPPENGLAERLHEIQLINGNETVPTTSNNYSVLETQQANEQCAQESEPAVISSDEDEPAEASTGEQRRNPGTIQHTNTSVNFHDEILPVTCGPATGMLIKRKLERGVTMKCIRSHDGNWFSLEELKIKGGYKSHWKLSVRCGGEPLGKLITEGILPKPPRVYGRRRPENSEKCKICQDEGKLFCCIACLGFFHGNCHLPPVESERNTWRCTFCTTQEGPKSQQCYKESEILGRQMGNEEKLKCDFVLLNVYLHLESNVFLNIPHENYVEQASQCLEKLRKLDKIKKNLIEEQYRQVEEFVRDMNHIFQDPKCSDSDLIEEEFKKHFKEVFAIQKPNWNSSLL